MMTLSQILSTLHCILNLSLNEHQDKNLHISKIWLQQVAVFTTALQAQQKKP